jgi:CRP/FNR family transcriptional regulator, cyclic AMP receptor protein
MQTPASCAHQNILAGAACARSRRLALNEQRKVIMARQRNRSVNWEPLLSAISRGKTPAEYGANCKIFQQGQSADSLLYILAGRVKLTVISKHGKEATIAILGAGNFLGEGCLAGQQLRTATATAATDCTLRRIAKSVMTRMIHERHEISELFVLHLLSRNVRYEADLVDMLFNSSEKRLARILLLLSHFGRESRAEPVLPRVSQENLARMVGTTRSRIGSFMNKFKKLGLIDYSVNGSLTVHGSLLGVVLHE